MRLSATRRVERDLPVSAKRDQMDVPVGLDVAMVALSSRSTQDAVSTGKSGAHCRSRQSVDAVLAFGKLFRVPESAQSLGQPRLGGGRGVLADGGPQSRARSSPRGAATLRRWARRSRVGEGPRGWRGLRCRAQQRLDDQITDGSDLHASQHPPGDVFRASAQRRITIEELYEDQRFLGVAA
jgi:hypothetical protein